MKAPLFSIIIPLYNKQSSIKKTLLSALNQQYTNFEIIIVNDGSTDKSVSIAQTVKDSRIKIFSQENKGVSIARNKGIKEASGKLIAFLDADDYWFPNHLKTIFQLYTHYPTCGMYCSRYSLRLAKNKIKYTNLEPDIAFNYQGIIPDFFKNSLHTRIAFTSATVAPKKILQQFGFNPLVSNGEDTELFIKIALRYKVAITNKFTCEYNLALPQQLSKNTITKWQLFDTNQFKEQEKKNKSLRLFLDIYRLEYALKFKVAGNNQQSRFYLNNNTTPIPKKTKILLQLPVFVLQLLLKIKHLFRKMGFDFTVYH